MTRYEMSLHLLSFVRFSRLSKQDDYRLSEGMKRVGYDADSGKYFFRDKDGCLWEGQEGARFGEMTQGTRVLLT